MTSGALLVIIKGKQAFSERRGVLGKMKVKSVTETFFKDGRAIRNEKTSSFKTFDEAARGLRYGRVTETELEDGSVVVTRTESKHVGTT